MDKFSIFIKQLTDRFVALPQGQKFAILALVAAGFASLFAMSLWVQTPDYQLLYSKLSPQDAAQIVERLKSDKIPYELSQGGQTIRVPSKDMHEIRLQLASEGLPEGGGSGHGNF